MKPHILIVDDDWSIVPLVEVAFKRARVEFDAAGNGREALSMLHDHSFDMVITDLDMPEMDGHELTEFVTRTYPKLPVVILTGKGSEDSAATCFKAGAKDYVRKEHIRRDLKTVVAKLLQFIDEPPPEEEIDPFAEEETPESEATPSAAEENAPSYDLTSEYHVLKWGDSVRRATEELGPDTQFTPEKMKLLRRRALQMEEAGTADAVIGSRQHERLYLGSVVYIFPLDAQDNPKFNNRFISFCRNISPGGCSLLHNRVILQKRFVIFFPRIGTNATRSVTIQAEIVRDRPTALGIYEIGVKFNRMVQLAPEDENFLKAAAAEQEAMR